MIDPTRVQYLQRPGNFVDGLAVNTAVIPSPRNYASLCFNAMSSVRLANNYRPKLYAIPDQSELGAGMTPFSDYMTQARIIPGSIIIGMSLVVLNWFTPPTDAAFAWQNNFYVGVEDDATGIPFFNDWLSEAVFDVPVLYNAPAALGVNYYVAQTAWLPLTRPRPVESPGTVTVKMCYKGQPSLPSPNMSPQLILICAQPCGIGFAKECS